METVAIIFGMIGSLIVGIAIGKILNKRTDGQLHTTIDPVTKSIYLSAEFNKPIEILLQKKEIVLEVDRETQEKRS